MFLSTEKPTQRLVPRSLSHEVGDTPLARTFLNEEVVMFRDADGNACALEDRCCHRATPLRLGEVVEEGLQCGYHGLVFDGKGACVKVPGQDVIPPKACVRSYPILERQEIVWIWMGDPPWRCILHVDFPWNDDQKNWPHIHDMFEIECNYMLLVDNLMDLTHIPYIHRNTIGGGDQSGQVNATMDVTKTDTGVFAFAGWTASSRRPYVKGAGFKEGALATAGRSSSTSYPRPSCNGQEHWKAAAHDNRDQPGGFNLRLYHGATPKTEQVVITSGPR